MVLQVNLSSERAWAGREGASSDPRGGRAPQLRRADSDNFLSSIALEGIWDLCGSAQSIVFCSCMNVRVKICGITRVEDALAAVEAGADALGFMFYASSPRCVGPRMVAEIVPQLPPFVARVGVFVNPSEEEVHRAVLVCGLDTLQFHGEESPEFCAKFGLKTIKAFRVRDVDSLQALASYRTDAWLLDSFVPGQQGGSGARFNWDLAREAQQHGRPIILAGGLDAENVAEAVRKVRPYAVDVSSGVEASPGKKDIEKIKRFVAAAKCSI